MFAACSETEVLDQAANQQAIENDGAVKFDVYSQRGITRGGGYTGDITNKTIVGRDKGFGVFAYYTAGETYSDAATPNFMYNQQIYTLADSARLGEPWKYEPVKYWPNEYGNAAISDEVDYVTFFAYAPYTKIVPETGEVYVGDITDAAKRDSAQNYNIISVKKNSATGDPIVKYVVDTNPASSVDLLWGVAAENADKAYTPIDGENGSKAQNKNVKVEPGMPFLNLVKPNDPQYDRLVFNLKHALAKVRFTIDYIDDAKTPEGPAKDTINANETRIFVRSFKISGWATQGALNLNNTEAGQPLWLDFDGVKDLVFDDITFFDGRKDKSEGAASADQKNEKPTGLNGQIIENFGSKENGGWTEAKNTGVGSMTLDAAGKLDVKDSVKYNDTRKSNQGTVLLFGGNPKENGGYFYVIPRNSNDELVDCEITYDVETVDTALATTLSDGLTKGISIENVISKKDILDGMDFKAGYQYDIHIHLGMTSVKIEATVTPWKETGTHEVDLPDNQDPYVENYWTIGDSPAIYTTDPTNFTLSTDRIYIVDDEASFNVAWSAGPLKAYYETPGTNYDPDPSDPRGHSWYGLASVKHDPDAGFGLPWVVLDLDLSPKFKGKITIKYDGKTVYENLNWTSGSGYLLMDGTDLKIKGQKPLETNTTSFLVWNDTASMWEKPTGYTKIDPTKFTIECTWDDSMIHENTKPTPQSH